MLPSHLCEASLCLLNAIDIISGLQWQGISGHPLFWRCYSIYGSGVCQRILFNTCTRDWPAKVYRLCMCGV